MTAEGFTLDKPEQINAWYLLSVVSKAHLHLKGYTQPGLLKWLRANVPDCKDTRTVKAAYPRLLDYCDSVGVVIGNTPDGMKEMCNYQILLTAHPDHPLHGVYLDQGIVSSLGEIAESFGEAYSEGRVVIIRTMDEVREKDPKIRMVMQD